MLLDSPKITGGSFFIFILIRLHLYPKFNWIKLVSCWPATHNTRLNSSLILAHLRASKIERDEHIDMLLFRSFYCYGRGG